VKRMAKWNAMKDAMARKRQQASAPEGA